MKRFSALRSNLLSAATARGYPGDRVDEIVRTIAQTVERLEGMKLSATVETTSPAHQEAFAKLTKTLMGEAARQALQLSVNGFCAVLPEVCFPPGRPAAGNSNPREETI